MSGTKASFVVDWVINDLFKVVIQDRKMVNALIVIVNTLTDL